MRTVFDIITLEYTIFEQFSNGVGREKELAIVCNINFEKVF